MGEVKVIVAGEIKPGASFGGESSAGLGIGGEGAFELVCSAFFEFVGYEIVVNRLDSSDYSYDTCSSFRRKHHFGV